MARKAAVVSLSFSPNAGRQGRLQPLLRQFSDLARRLRLGDDLVDLGEQRELVLVEPDIAGAVLDYEFQRRRTGRDLFSDRGGHRVAGGDQVDLTGHEGGDGGVVVLETLDGGVRRGRGGQRLFLDRAAGGADGLALEIGGAGNRGGLGAGDSGEEWGIGGGG